MRESRIASSQNVWNIEWQHGSVGDKEVFHVAKVYGDVTDGKSFSKALLTFIKERNIDPATVSITAPGSDLDRIFKETIRLT